MPFVIESYKKQKQNIAYVREKNTLNFEIIKANKDFINLLKYQIYLLKRTFELIFQINDFQYYLYGHEYILLNT